MKYRHKITRTVIEITSELEGESWEALEASQPSSEQESDLISEEDISSHTKEMPEEEVAPVQPEEGKQKPETTKAVSRKRKVKK
ncbi:hypothetical protein [Moryella indoligenes]|uniref:hypothetical protein n=1 Tax=Moryella indoligenes TaxID=371674 RepID=UPI0027D7B2EB|nr:hypothetical protein [Moryella indoligenes]